MKRILFGIVSVLFACGLVAYFEVRIGDRFPLAVSRSMVASIVGIMMYWYERISRERKLDKLLRDAKKAGMNPVYYIRDRVPDEVFLKCHALRERPELVADYLKACVDQKKIQYEEGIILLVAYTKLDELKKALEAREKKSRSEAKMVKRAQSGKKKMGLEDDSPIE